VYHIVQKLGADKHLMLLGYQGLTSLPVIYKAERQINTHKTLCCCPWLHDWLQRCL